MGFLDRQTSGTSLAVTEELMYDVLGVIPKRRLLKGPGPTAMNILTELPLAEKALIFITWKNETEVIMFTCSEPDTPFNHMVTATYYDLCPDEIFMAMRTKGGDFLYISSSQAGPQLLSEKIFWGGVFDLLNEKSIRVVDLEALRGDLAPVSEKFEGLCSPLGSPD